MQLQQLSGFGPAQLPGQYNDQRSFWDKLMELLGGTSSRYQATTNYDPQQLQAFQSLLSDALQTFQNPQYKSPSFSGIEQQALEHFHTNTAPSIAQRFTTLGGSGTRNSGGLQGAILGAGAGLERSLAALKQQHAGQLLNLGLTPKYETAYFPRQPGAIENLLGFAAKGLGQAAGSYFGGL
jgi:hypothetical protein